ncbi:MAG: hypothetical protein GX540_08965 [Clostridiales bacterium]|nr:hypothetical protein [Clostridiales bacterium]
MKRIILLLVICLLLIPAALADKNIPIKLEPGIYEIGKDLPSGHYDVRFKGLDYIIRINYSSQLKEDRSLDMMNFYSYSLSYSAKDWWQAVYPIIYVLDGGYLQIEHSSCELWLED